MAVPAHPPPGYARRTPEQTVLYGALREHAETFLAEVETDPASSGLPGFVRAEVERFLKCGIPTRADKRARRRRMQSAVGGFDLQAGVRIAARHRHQLEHLARYLLRPAVSTERLKALPDGRFVYELKRPWADGTTGFLFDPHELIEKLVALIPLPRGNLVRYHGLFAPRAAGRSGVVQAGEGEASSAVRPAEQVPHRLPWADLLRRVFLVDVLCCTRCGGRRRVLEAVTDPGAAARILLHLGLEATAPRAEPARAPPDHLGIAS